MGADQPRRPTLLWVGKAPVNDGGDEIYDRRVLALLARDFAVTRFEMALQPRRKQLQNILRGLPQPCFKYASKDIDRAFVEAASVHDHVVVSLEAFEHLVRLVERPVTLIVHNVTHDILSQLYGHHPIGRLAAAQSQHWERRLYRRDAVRLVALSRRDQALIAGLAPGRAVAIAPPGAPPLTPLAGPSVLREVVLSGSYDWRAKRRDLIALAHDIVAEGQQLVWRHDLALPDDPEIAPIRASAHRIEPAEYGQAIRFGLIPDRFLGGFKLKATYFIANNCIVLSRCDIGPEFAGLPFAEHFVRYTPRVCDIQAAIAAILSADSDALCRQWLQFQAACATRFSWQRAAAAVAG